VVESSNLSGDAIFNILIDRDANGAEDERLQKVMDDFPNPQHGKRQEASRLWAARTRFDACAFSRKGTLTSSS
jgi:hypothetical protein